MRISRRDMLTAGVGALTAAAAPRALAEWEPSDRYPDPAIQILNPSFAKYRLNNAGIERLAVGMRWAEGPVWFGDGLLSPYHKSQYNPRLKEVKIVKHNAPSQP